MKPHIEKIFLNIEEGKLLKKIQIVFLITIGMAFLIGGIELTPKEVTRIYESDEDTQYHIKKVSRIPKEKEKEEKEKKAVEDDDRLTAEELKERYYQYVLARIQQNKEYPLSEQKKGHEGSVLLRVIIQRSGKVNKVQILRQARYLKLTRAAITAIKKSNPFQPYSENIEEDLLRIQLEMEFFLK
jgi:TonB family protein